MTMKLRIGYYALLREARGLSEEQVETTAQTTGALYAELAGKHGFTLRGTQLKVAVNDVFAAWDTALNEGDHVVFIPPVAGG